MPNKPRCFAYPQSATAGSYRSCFMLSFVSSQKKSLCLCEVNEGRKEEGEPDPLSSIFSFLSLSSSPVELQLRN